MAFFSDDELETLSQTTVRIAPLVEMVFDDETFTVWNGDYPLTSGGKTWLPMHGAGQVEGLSGGPQSQTQRVTLTLSGIPDSTDGLNFLSKALNEFQSVQQRSAFVYFQLLDAGWQPVGAPISVFWGFMQPAKISRTAMQDDEGASQIIQIEVLNAMFNRSRPPNGRLTDLDQQNRHPGDLSMEFQPSLLMKSYVWPSWN